MKVLQMMPWLGRKKNPLLNLKILRENILILKVFSTNQEFNCVKN